MDFSKMKRYMGDPKQIFRVDDYRLNGGRGDGMRMLHVHNGADIEFVCSADRCFDLHYLRCKGQNMGFLTCAGDVAPHYYDDKGFGWLKSFTAGFMTTCGVQTIGLPEEYLGRARGLHGRISNCPAEEAGVQVREEDGGMSAELRGVMRDSYPTGENLVLTRTIHTSLGDPNIRIRDVVHNSGFSDALHMILYHFNVGFPLLSEEARLLIPSRKTVPRDRDAAAHLGDWRHIQAPADGLPEMCYYHDLKCGENGRTFVSVFNPALGIGVAIHFDRRVLDHFVQWRQLTAGYYTMGLEPCNATIDGVADAIRNGSAKWLKPGESVTYDLTVEIVTDEARFRALAAESETYR